MKVKKLSRSLGVRVPDCADMRRLLANLIAPQSTLYVCQANSQRHGKMGCESGMCRVHTEAWDVVFSYCDTAIKAVGVATGTAASGGLFWRIANLNFVRER